MRTLTNRGTHTPIAAVVSDNNGSAKSGIAMSLQLALGTHRWATVNNNQDTHQMSSSFATHFLAVDGYQQTWSNYYSMNNTTVKGTSGSYPAFYAAGRFQFRPNSVTLSGNLSEWYLPSLGDWKIAIERLGYLRMSGISNFGKYSVGWNPRMYKVIIVQAGGQYFPSTYCWAASEIDKKFAVFVATEPNHIEFGTTGKDQGLFIRPFIKF